MEHQTNVSAGAAKAAGRTVPDADLGARNADYKWFRGVDERLPLPGLVLVKPGGFDDWMRSRGKLGGQNKVPRMDNTGALTNQLLEFLRATNQVACEIIPATQRETE